MREIKFRGMDANGIMRYGRLSQDKPDSTAYYKEYSQRICWDDSNIPVRNDTVEMFTGKKDKNEKEIYGGDIINYHCAGGISNSAVIWNDDEARFERSNAPYMSGGIICGQYDEIIGNLYESPELLEGKEK